MLNETENSVHPLLLRLPDLQKVIGISRTSIYEKLKKDPAFPRPVKLGAGSIAWRFAEVKAWVESLPHSTEAA